MWLAWVAPAWALNVLEVGDSNANGTVADSVWGGLPVQSGYTYRHNGVDHGTWPTGNAPTVGKGPYLVDLAADAGGWYCRRGTNGATAGTVLASGQWAAAVADVAALGGVPDILVLDIGANDGKTWTAASAYEGNLGALIDDALARWPGLDVVIARERTTNAGAAHTYPFLRTTIYSAIADLDALYPEVRVADGTLCDLYEAIHWSTGGHGGGQECVANLILP